MSRYDRQIAVPGFGAVAQDWLRATRLLVVGAGGLAAPVLPYLVGAGVGHIRLVDPDRVDRGNLHRQTLFRESDIGARKACAAARSLRALNPEVEVEAIAQALDPANADALAEGCDLILDCADSFAVSYILSDLCRDSDRPLVSASVLGLEGYVGAFCGGAPSLRAVFPALPARMGSCAEDGVLGPVVGLLGSLQAQMALALAGRLDPSPLGRLVSVDAATLRFGGFGFHGAPEPAQSPRFIAASDLRSSDWIVDLRAATEAPLVHPDAQRLSVEGIATAPPPAPGRRAVLCCRSGLRSWQAAQQLAPVWAKDLAKDWDGEIVLLAMGDPNGDPS